MIRRRTVATTLAALATPGARSHAAAPATPATLSADQVLERVRDRPDGQDICADVTLALAEPDGSRRERQLLYLQKKYGRDQRLTLYFTDPAPVRGVGLQSVTRDEASTQADEQWIYLPALRQVRRVAVNDKRGAFMGSQFSYADLDRLRVHDHRQGLVGRERVLERDCHVIEREPLSAEVLERTGYGRQRLWVDAQTFIVLKQAFHDPAGLLFKQLEVRRLELIQGIWSVMDSVMHDKVSGRTSTLLFRNVRYDLGLDDALFRQDILKTGIDHGRLPALR